VHNLKGRSQRAVSHRDHGSEGLDINHNSLKSDKLKIQHKSEIFHFVVVNFALDVGAYSDQNVCSVTHPPLRPTAL
jgi:hypothetical protein